MKTFYQKYFLEQRAVTLFLSLLIVFLPFSSWLVSLTGITQISLIRDAILFLVLLSSLPSLINKKIIDNRTQLIVGALFVVWAILSVIWREASLEQWVRGLRFTLPPIVLFLILSQIKIPLRRLSFLVNAVCLAAILIAITALLDVFNSPLPLTTSLSGSGTLESAHYVGLLMIKRAQGIMAGPNALGLFLLPAFAISITWPSKSLWPKILSLVLAMLIILTFSRSALIGLLVIVLLLFWQKAKDKIGSIKTIIISMALLLLLVCAGFVINKTTWGKQVISHNSSSSLRLEQYQRIWQQKYNIGLIGRGLGTAGPSSINRLDGGENHWTENVYLDVFEELGLIGTIIFIIFIIVFIVKTSKINNNLGRATSLALWAFAISGIFINIYTGQAGFWYVMLLLGLAINTQSNIKDKK